MRSEVLPFSLIQEAPQRISFTGGSVYLQGNLPGDRLKHNAEGNGVKDVVIAILRGDADFPGEGLGGHLLRKNGAYERRPGSGG